MLNFIGISSKTGCFVFLRLNKLSFCFQIFSSLQCVTMLSSSFLKQSFPFIAMTLQIALENQELHNDMVIVHAECLLWLPQPHLLLLEMSQFHQFHYRLFYLISPTIIFEHIVWSPSCKYNKRDPFCERDAMSNKNVVNDMVRHRLLQTTRNLFFFPIVVGGAKTVLKPICALILVHNYIAVHFPKPFVFS